MNDSFYKSVEINQLNFVNNSILRRKLIKKKKKKRREKYMSTKEVKFIDPKTYIRK